MSGRVVAEFEDYSLYELSTSKPIRFEPGAGKRVPGPHETYWMAYSYQVAVSTYEQALGEPEWEVFI